MVGWFLTGFGKAVLYTNTDGVKKTCWLLHFFVYSVDDEWLNMRTMVQALQASVWLALSKFEQGSLFVIRKATKEEKLPSVCSWG